MTDAMAWRRRLDEIVEGLRLAPDVAERLAVLLELLRDDETAPTTITDPCVGVDRHVHDALAALALPAVRTARSVADLGSGAGVPGLPLAIALPRAQVRLVEPASPKVRFLARAVAACDTPNAEPVHARAETWAGGLGACDLCTARALAPLAVLVEYAAPLLRIGGALVAWKGRRDAAEESAGASAAAVVGLEARGVHSVPARPGADHRHLHLYVKVAPLPSRFPRAPGKARKRPLAT